jgi:putative salt-induced outer membrane protein
MIRNTSVAILALAVMAIAQPVRAEWSGKAELGASMATGNSDSQSANGALEFTYKADKWENLLGFMGNYGSDGNTTTAQRWEVRGQTNYSFTERAYWFGAARYDDDRFSAYDYQASLATGLGYKFYDTENTKLWVQGGPGYRVTKERETGDTVDGVIFRGNVGFEKQITETTKVVNLFLIESGSSNTYLQNNLGLEVTISGSLGLRVGYEVRHNTDVPVGVDKTDTLTTVGLMYETK